MTRLSNLPPGVSEFDDHINPPEPELDIQHDDYVISDARRGGYCVNHLGGFPDFDSAIEAIIEHMNRERFWPNVWFVNDHGNTDLLSVNTETGETEIVSSWV